MTYFCRFKSKVERSRRISYGARQEKHPFFTTSLTDPSTLETALR
jgi:hypothetical protein